MIHCFRLISHLFFHTWALRHRCHICVSIILEIGRSCHNPFGWLTFFCLQNLADFLNILADYHNNCSWMEALKWNEIFITILLYVQSMTSTQSVQEVLVILIPRLKPRKYLSRYEAETVLVRSFSRLSETTFPRSLVQYQFLRCSITHYIKIMFFFTVLPDSLLSKNLVFWLERVWLISCFFFFFFVFFLTC